MRLSGVEIPPGECRIIINLGQEQDSMLYHAKKTNCQAPYQPEFMDVEARSASIVASFFARFKSK